jgi:hypothetical protein
MSFDLCGRAQVLTGESFPRILFDQWRWTVICGVQWSRLASVSDEFLEQQPVILTRRQELK